MPQWLIWRYGQRESKPPRSRLTPTAEPGQGRRSRDLGELRRGSRGPGLPPLRRHRLRLHGEDPYVGIDLDHCRDPQSWSDRPPGAGDHRRVRHLRRGQRLGQRRAPHPARSHAAWQPSSRKDRRPRGGGLREGPLLRDHRRGALMTTMVERRRLSAVPGGRTSSRTSAVGSRGQACAQPRPRSISSVVTGLGDEEVIARAQAAANGDQVRRPLGRRRRATHRGDASAADLALASMLAYWCRRRPRADGSPLSPLGSHAAQVGRASLRDGSTYGEHTLERALEQAPATKATKATKAHLEAAAAWPRPLGGVAFHGVLGRLVAALEPHTEADPAALAGERPRRRRLPRRLRRPHPGRQRSPSCAPLRRPGRRDREGAQGHELGTDPRCPRGGRRDLDRARHGRACLRGGPDLGGARPDPTGSSRERPRTGPSVRTSSSTPAWPTSASSWSRVSSRACSR